MDTMRKTTEPAVPIGGFGHVLAVVDRSGDGRHAAAFAAVVADQFGAALTIVEVSETKSRHRSGAVHGLVGNGLVGNGLMGNGLMGNGHEAAVCTISGPTIGARHREMSGQIAAAARTIGADVIVLGLDRHRLARHRLAPSLRALVAEASEVAVLQAPPITVHEEDETTAPDGSGVDPLGVEVAGTLPKGRYADV